LWLASYLVHLRKVHWRVGAHWLYSHLLDGDLASNALNWQLVAGVRGDKPYLFNADQVARYAPAEWHSAGTTIDNQEHFIELVAHSRATLAQVQRSEFGWEEPAVHTTAPASTGCIAPDPDLVRGKSVWWVHPWHLAELPAQLPPEMVVVAALWAEPLAAHPWDERRWAFVTQRMRALTPHVWFGSEAELVGAFAQAREVHTVSHLRVPDWTEVRWWKQPLPRLFRRLDAPVATFPQWWLQVNRQVRYLHQLVSLGKPRAA
jgi:deoxyribodipyrimidine photo-lyase